MMCIINFVKISAIVFLTALFYPCFGQQSMQEVIEGKLIHLNAFQSKFVEKRNIDIWLPSNYDGNKKFAVLFMHDGQMLFDSLHTWNKTSWDIDDVSAQLINKGLIKDHIIVGIWNSGPSRHNDYFPQKPLESLSKEELKYVSGQLSGNKENYEFKSNADAYLLFIINELKPYIDTNYKVYTEQPYTFIGGSSMGGLISLYAICEYPEVFHGAACLSTHWPGIFTTENNPIPNAFFNYLSQKLPEASNHRIYFDYGTATLDALYPPLQQKVDDIMFKKGFNENSWITRKFDGSEHSEKAWHDRVHIPLLFLMGTN